MENSYQRLAAIILHFALGGQAIPRDHVHCLAATATRERVSKRAKLRLFTGERDTTSARYYAVTWRERRVVPDSQFERELALALVPR
jgi:hypothetical protein